MRRILLSFFITLIVLMLIPPVMLHGAARALLELFNIAGDAMRKEPPEWKKPYP